MNVRKMTLTLLLGAASVSSAWAAAPTNQEIEAVFKREFPKLIHEGKTTDLMGRIMLKRMDITYGVFNAIMLNDVTALGRRLNRLIDDGDTAYLLTCLQVKNAAGKRFVDFIAHGKDGNAVHALLDEAIEAMCAAEFPKLVEYGKIPLSRSLMFRAIIFNDAVALQKHFDAIVKANRGSRNERCYGDILTIYEFKHKGKTGKQFVDFAVEGKDGDKVRKIFSDFFESCRTFFTDKKRLASLRPDELQILELEAEAKLAQEAKPVKKDSSMKEKWAAFKSSLFK